MRDASLIILFLIISSITFIINDIKILIIGLLLSNIYLYFRKIKYKGYINFLKKNFLLFSVIIICNLFLDNIHSTIIISLKLSLILTITYIFTYNFSPLRIANGLCYLLKPLKIYKIDIKRVSLTIIIALNFITILIKEAEHIKISLESKGFSFTIKNAFFRPQIFLITYLENIFSKVDTLEKTLLIKGYE